MIRPFLFLSLTCLLASCAGFDKPDEGGSEGPQALSSYQILPVYPMELTECLQNCSQKNATLSSDGLDDLRRCGCTCHEKYPVSPYVLGRFCSNADGVTPMSNRNTLDDLVPKNKNS